MEKESIEKAEKAIKRKRGHLLLTDPFYSTAALKTELIPAKKYKHYIIETAATNGKAIFYNPDYINSLSDKQITFLLVHEYWHILLIHHVRMKNRDHKTWNRAGDYTINGILVSDKIGEFIEGCLFNPEYSDYSTEKNYKILLDDQAGDDETININDPAGGCIPIEKEDLEPGETFEDIQEDIKTDIVNSVNFAEKAGKGVSEYVKNVISEIVRPKTNYKDLLASWLNENNKTDFSFIKPSYRSNNGFILPGLFDESLGKVVIGIDVSKSITSRKGALETFQENINQLRLDFQFETIVIYFHSEIVKIDSYQKHETIKIDIPSTGGTRIKPVFDYIQDNNLNNSITGLIVFTDLEIWDYPKNDPCFPVLWLQYGKCQDCLPTFGEVVNIDD